MYVFMYVGVYEGCSRTSFPGFFLHQSFSHSQRGQTLPVENTVVHLISSFLVLYS
jgi:hypothetical protein